MAFVSMFFVMIILISMGIGLLNLIIGLILDIIWNGKKKKGIPVHGVMKFFAIASTVLGVLLFLIPAVIFGVISVMAKIDQDRKMASFDEIVYVENVSDWREEFEFDGKTLIKADFLNPSHKAEVETCGAVYLSEKEYREVYKVENSSGYTIYQVDNTGMYVAKDEYQKIKDYIYNDVKTESIVKDRLNGQEYPVQFTLGNLMQVRDSIDIYNLPREKKDTKDIQYQYSIWVIAENQLARKSFYYSEIDGEIYEEINVTAEDMNGRKLREEEQELIRTMIQRDTDIYE